MSEKYPRKCNWCQEQLMKRDTKKYCASCAKYCVQECTTCHKPYPHLRYFHHHQHICNSCCRKYSHRKEKAKKNST